LSQKSGSQYGGKSVSGFEDGNDSFDLEDFDTIQNKILLDSLLEDRKKAMQKKEEHFRKSFLVSFFEEGESRFGECERSKSKERRFTDKSRSPVRAKAAMVAAATTTTAGPTSPQKPPKSILRKVKNVDD
jgi:hypothetical protein